MRNEREERLLAAFRKMHPDDGDLLLDLAEVRAAKQVLVKPRLQLVGANSSPPDVPALSRGSGKI